jgi:hypothetical protein
MSSIEEVLKHLSQHLAAGRHPWALIGGLAVSARARPRFTNDVDFAVGVPGDREAEALVHSLLGQGYRVLACLEHERLGRLSTVRLLPPGQDEDGIIADLLFASCGIEAELASAATDLEALPGVRLPVATVGHLLAMKLLAMDDRRRPLDRTDIMALLEKADEQEIQRAREAISLIEQRGFSRGKDLRGLLESFLERP